MPLIGHCSFIHYSFIMPICIDNSAPVTSDGAKSDILSKNALTTAGCVLAAGTGVAGAGILFMALPGQMTVAATLTGGLLYAGHRQSVGKPIIPGTGDKSAPAATTTVNVTATADAEPAAA
jgi:hypothetical protein